MLEVRGLHVSYGAIPVLHNVGFDVREGEIVALVGSNGAGKTTALNTISGLLRCTSGSIALSGKNIENSSPHQIVKAGVVQIPEGRELFPYLSLKENLFMGACTPRAWKERHSSWDRVCGLFPVLRERGNQRASLLSGGEQQMLAIARGLMALPELLLIDEPSLGLAPTTLEQIYEVIKTFPENGITVLLSEQNAQNALEIANRGYVLQDGEIVLEGSGNSLLGSELVKKAYLGV